jgi:hypothetical protein
MFERMSWSSAYELWEHSRYFFPKSLFEAPAAESVFVDYNQENYIYGYDWLSNEETEERKQLIKDNPSQFLYFTQPTNKGTIQTAQMRYCFCDPIGTNGDIWRHMTTYGDIGIVSPPQRKCGGFVEVVSLLDTEKRSFMRSFFFVFI